MINLHESMRPGRDHVMSHLGQCYVDVMPLCYVSSQSVLYGCGCHHVMSHLSQCYVNVMPLCYVSSQSVLYECDAIMLCLISVSVM